MQRDRLVVADVAPCFALAREELGIEAPCDHRVDDHVVGAVDVHSFRDREKVTVAAGDSRSAGILFY